MVGGKRMVFQRGVGVSASELQATLLLMESDTIKVPIGRHRALDGAVDLHQIHRWVVDVQLPQICHGVAPRVAIEKARIV